MAGNKTRAAPWALLAAVLLATPAACQRGADITIWEDGGSAIVTARLTGGDRVACIDDLSVFADDGTVPLWHVAAAPDAPCVSRLVLGSEPSGFAPDTGMAPPRLDADRGYRIEISGRGFLAATHLAAGRTFRRHRS